MSTRTCRSNNKMVKIEQKSFGYKLTFSGIISISELENWLEESETILEKETGSFSVFVDMQQMELLPVACRELMYEGQKLYKRMGMERSVVIVGDKLTAMQFRLIAQKTGIYADERYIDASQNENWEKEAINWIIKAIEPSVENQLTQ